MFQEENGIYNFNRSDKFPIERIRAAQVRRAAIEEKFDSPYRMSESFERVDEVEAQPTTERELVGEPV